MSLGYAYTIIVSACVEVPFDKAKLAMFGGSASAVLRASLMRVPLASLLLLGYDSVFTKQFAGRLAEGRAERTLQQ